MDPLIVVDNVTYSYPGTEAHAAPALRGLSLRIYEHVYVAIVGANGSGKSTLARHLNALLVPDQGSVWVAGLNTRGREHHPTIRRIVGMVFQRPDDQTVATLVEHDVAFGPENLGLPRDEIRTRVREALEAVDLWTERHRPPHMLSAGQMQRLALAGVLAVRPRCIIFDEVTAMLDPAGRRAARALMHRLHEEGVTIMTITHLMEEALDADHVIVLSEGDVALEGTPQEVFQQDARLRRLGLDVPLPTAIADRLRPTVPGLPQTILTAPALVEALDDLDHCGAHDTPRPAPAPKAGPKPLIEVEDLGHVYMDGTPFAHRALQDVMMTVYPQRPHGLIGATGSGKSTLLQHLNGLLRPQEGTVRVGRYHLGRSDVDIRAVRRMVGLVFQRPEAQIFEQYVGDEIAYGPRLAGLKGSALRERVRWAMELVGLGFEAFKDRFTFALSGGEQRKVALASTLALQPQVLLLDEPTAGLDPASRRELIEHLKGFESTGMTVVLSSHQMEDIAALTQEVTVMAAGTSVYRGTVAATFSEGDRLHKWSLAQPAVSEIAEALRARGWDLPHRIVTETELIDAIQACL